MTDSNVDTVGSRSEALASLLLELHGLQDMLDRLWEWVGGAEATLAATEANPVGNDLNTVERQLSEHEVHVCITYHDVYCYQVVALFPYVAWSYIVFYICCVSEVL